MKMNFKVYNYLLIKKNLHIYTMKFIVALIAVVAAQAEGDACGEDDAACDEGLCCGAAAEGDDPTCGTEEADVFTCAAAGGDDDGEAVEEKATTLALGAAFATLAYTLA